MFALKYDNGAFNNEVNTMPLAFFSVLVATSSTKTLLDILTVSFTTFAINITIKYGTTLSNDISFMLLPNISFVNHPIAIGVTWVNAAEIIIIKTISINMNFCLRSNNLYIFFNTKNKSFFFFFIKPPFRDGLIFNLINLVPLLYFCA